MPEQTPEESFREYIVDRLQDAVNAWCRGDLGGVMDVYLPGESTSSLMGNVVNWDYDGILKSYRKSIVDREEREMHIQVDEVVLFGAAEAAEYAYVFGQLAKLMKDGTDGCENFTLFMKCVRGDEDTWYIFKEHRS